MNQAQRKFLIDKIESMGKIKRRALEESIPKRPSISMFLFREVMNGNVKIVSNERIIELIEDKALRADESRDDWMGDSWGSASKNKIHFKVRDIFVLPEDYNDKNQLINEKEKKIRKQISELIIQEDTLVTRIHLASNSTLESMIKEVDDMGNISLMDTKLKQLTN